MQYSVNTVVKIVKATCVLHNFLRDKNINVANIYAHLNPEQLDYLGENGTVQAMNHKEFDKCSHMISTALLVVYIGKMLG